jgi:antitoxin component YwqK of YwqJK toxin-antitoxin module
MWRRNPVSAARALCLSLLLFVGPRGADGAQPLGETVSKGDPELRSKNGFVTYRGRSFSGYVVEHEGGRLLSRSPHAQGKEHGLVEAWYPDGSLRYQKLYRAGHREGTHRGFWPGGKPQFIYHYERDLFEGEQIAFYKNGVRSELRHYRNGREEGQQQFYDGEGRIIANYTFKHGRRYGIVGRFDCVSMVDE